MNPKNVYALLIAIDKYPIYPLGGCVNDSKDVENYLTQSIEAENLHLKKLWNEDATKENIVDAFLNHLTQATENDAVFVHYSGHGSQERAPEIFWDVEPDRKNEVLVCVDSLIPQKGLHNPLADKEIKWLIQKVAEKKPHITIVFDCCHSGTATRDIEEVTSRYTPANQRALRAVNDYIFFQEKYGGKALKKGEKLNIEAGRHILLSGCRSNQTAKELRLDGRQRGAFTYSLLQSLINGGGTISYRDIIKQAGAFVRNKVNDQNPQLDAVETQDVQHIFLGGASQQKPYYSVNFSKKENDWVLDAGSIHGISAPENEEPTILSLYAKEADLDKNPSSIHEAKAKSVSPHMSTISFDNQDLTDKTTVFKATVDCSPVPRVKVFLEAELPNDEAQQNALVLLRQAVATSTPNANPSLYVEEVTECDDDKDYRVVAYTHEDKNRFRITRLNDELPIAKQLDGFEAATAEKLVQQLEHIARWHQTLNLANATTDLKGVELVVLDEKGNELAVNDGVIHLPATHNKKHDVWVTAFKVKVINNSDKPLYYALLNMTQKFDIDTRYMTMEYLEPKAEIFANDGKVLRTTINKNDVNLGVSQVNDFLKLIVSEEEFDATLLEQKALAQAETLRGNREIKRGGKNSLNQLLRQVNTRAFIELDEDAPVVDWTTKTLTVRTLRPMADVTDQLLKEAGIEVTVPDTLQATFQLSSIEQASIDSSATARTERATRSAEQPVQNSERMLLPSFFNDANNDTETLSLIQTRSTAPNLNILEIKDLANSEAITPETPLSIQLPIELAENEVIIPIASDGELFFPLGISQATADGTTQIDIEYLPSSGTTSGAVTERSVGSTIKILFQKVVSKTLRRDKESTRLAMVTLEEDNGKRTLTYNNSHLEIANVLDNAERIALVVHGFIGDTETMLMPKNTETNQHLHAILKDNYDLILAFDYDSYNTEMRDSARQLKSHLAKIGLSAGHSKQVDLIAHSTGGLVARWMIEQQGGNELVSRLILSGVPNGGAPWPAVKDWMVFATTLAMNGLTLVGWAFPTLLAILGTVKGLGGWLGKRVAKKVGKNVQKVLEDKVTEDLAKNSDFLKMLNDSSVDPEIPYIIYKGNTSLIKDSDEKTRALVGRIFHKMGLDQLPYVLIDFLFAEDNDIAISTKSMEAINANRKPRAEVYTVACDHLNYYTTLESLEKLREGLRVEEEDLA